MLHAEKYVASNRDELVARYTVITKDLVSLYQEYADAASAEEFRRYEVIREQRQLAPETSQSRLEYIAKEVSYAERDTVRKVQMEIKRLEAERMLLDALVKM